MSSISASSRQQFPVVDVHQFTDGPTHDLLRIATEHAAECRVGLHDALAVVLDQQDAEWALIEDAAETLFALPQCVGVGRRKPLAAVQVAAHDAEHETDQRNAGEHAEHD